MKSEDPNEGRVPVVDDSAVEAPAEASAAEASAASEASIAPVASDEAAQSPAKVVPWPTNPKMPVEDKIDRLFKALTDADAQITKANLTIDKIDQRLSAAELAVSAALDTIVEVGGRVRELLVRQGEAAVEAAGTTAAIVPTATAATAAAVAVPPTGDATEEVAAAPAPVQGGYSRRAQAVDDAHLGGNER